MSTMIISAIHLGGCEIRMNGYVVKRWVGEPDNIRDIVCHNPGIVEWDISRAGQVGIHASPGEGGHFCKSMM